MSVEMQKRRIKGQALVQRAAALFNNICLQSSTTVQDSKSVQQI